jgi:hypothetical protein
MRGTLTNYAGCNVCSESIVYIRPTKRMQQVLIRDVFMIITKDVLNRKQVLFGKAGLFYLIEIGKGTF